MANLYGVANAPQICFEIPNFAATTTCNANVYTAFFVTNPIIAPSQGWFQAAVWASVEIATGATPPSGLSFALAIGAGSYGTPALFAGNVFLPSAYTAMTLINVTPASQVAWQGAGSTVSFGLNPSNQLVQVVQNSNALIMLIRAPDQ